MPHPRLDLELGGQPEKLVVLHIQRLGQYLEVVLKGGTNHAKAGAPAHVLPSNRCGPLHLRDVSEGGYSRGHVL
jgi:hypothetical protein